jgi:hypothetical protein
MTLPCILVTRDSIYLVSPCLHLVIAVTLIKSKTTKTLLSDIYPNNLSLSPRHRLPGEVNNRSLVQEILRLLRDSKIHYLTFLTRDRHRFLSRGRWIQSTTSCNISLRLLLKLGSRDSAVGFLTDYGLDDRGVGDRVPVWLRTFSYPRRPERLWGSPILLPNGCPGAVSSSVKRQRREADHSPPTSAEVNKMWIYTAISPYVFMA